MFMYDIGIKPKICQPKLEDEIFTSNKVNPKVTVITPSFNQGEYLEECILSVARQSFKNIEHLIIDSVSTDSTKEVIDKYPHVTFICEKDRGVQDAIVKGCFLAKGKYIILIPSSDGILDENWLANSVNLLESDSEIDMVWGLVQRVENGVLKPNLHFPELWDINHLRYRECPQKQDWYDYWKIHKPWGFEISMVVKREIFIECYVQAAWSSTLSFYQDDFYLMDFLEFYIFFNKKRYLPFFIKTVACFARNHENSFGETLNWHAICKDYFKKVDRIEGNFEKNIINLIKQDDCTLIFTPNFDGLTQFRVTIDGEDHFVVDILCDIQQNFFIYCPAISHADAYLEFEDKKIKINSKQTNLQTL